jgi:hypothetical protein
LEPVYATLFDTRIYLGIDLIALGAARLAERNGRDVRLEPDGEGKVLITLQHPDLAPPEAARPRGGIDGHGRIIVRAIYGEDDAGRRQTDGETGEDKPEP